MITIDSDGFFPVTVTVEILHGDPAANYVFRVWFGERVLHEERALTSLFGAAERAVQLYSEWFLRDLGLGGRTDVETEAARERQG